MNIYRPCVSCSEKAPQHLFPNTDDSVFWRKKTPNTYTISRVGKTQGFWLEIWLDTFCNLKHIALLENGAITSSRLSPPGGGRESERWPLGDVGVTTSLGSRPQQARTEEAAAVRQVANGPRESASPLLILGNASILTHVQVRPQSRGSSLTQCCVTRQPRPSANQANSIVGNRSICVTLKGCINHTHMHEKQYLHS